MFNAIVTDVRQQRRHGTSHFPEWGVSRNLVETGEKPKPFLGLLLQEVKEAKKVERSKMSE